MEIKGIDVSKWQGNINWNEVKKRWYRICDNS